MKKIFFVPVFMVFLCSCQSDEVRTNIPFVHVYEEVNVESTRNKDLWNTGGHITLDAGYKGIILVNEGDDYHAFERACTYDTEAECALVEMDDSELFLIDHCCNSSFNFSGKPIGGPATLELLEYRSYRDGDFLIIVNE